jgi:type IV pilus assembly protein PilC
MDFEYVGYTADRRVVKGKIAAETETDAGDRLTRNGYQILSIKHITPFLSDTPTFFAARVKPDEVIMFSRQLALLLESGVGIVQGLELLKAQTVNKRFASMLATVVTDLRTGLPVSTALEKHPEAFNKMYCKIIAVGEQTGQLESVLRNLANYAEQSSSAVKKIKQAMTYPIIVFVLAVLVGILAVTFILPPIMRMFKALGGKLPLITQILIDTVNFFSEYGIYVLAGVIALTIVTYIYVKTPEGAYQKDKLLLTAPVIGRLNLLNNLARICRSITLLFKSGLPLPDILTLTSDSAGNRVVSRALQEVESDIIKGDALALSMKKKPVFLPLMVEMTKVGEETGNLDNTLTIVAESFEIEAADKMQTVLGLIEPAMTIIIGLGVGFLALSIFIPIYSSLSLVGG